MVPGQHVVPDSPAADWNFHRNIHRIGISDADANLIADTEVDCF